MYFDAIIPIRSKSKGLKNKNILRFKKDENLANFTIKKILNIKSIKKIHILTDSNNYKKKIIKHPKVEINFNRPKKLSNDNSKIDDLIKYFIN